MKINTIIFTTSTTSWMERDFAFIRQQLQRAPGVIVEDIDIKHISLDKIPTRTDKDGDVKPDWNWFTKNFTQNAKGYNAVCLHISPSERKKYGITPKGTYRRDDDEIFEFWICAGKSERSKKYNMSEFARVFIHEQCHGFERFVHGYDVNLVHHYDYVLKNLLDVIPLMDFTEWNKLHDERDALVKKRDSLLSMVSKTVNSFVDMLTPKVLLIPEEFFEKVSQKFMEKNDHYKSGVHPGVDFACPAGTPVSAPTTMEIYASIKDHPSLGNAAFVKCTISGKQYWMRFLHLAAVMPVGKYSSGDIIGYTGNTGDSTGAHLHTDIWTVPIDANLIATADGVKKYMIDPVEFWKLYTL